MFICFAIFLAQDFTTRSYLFAFLTFGLVLLHLRLKPYATDLDNNTESGMLFALLALCIVLTGANDYVSTPGTLPLSIQVPVILLVFLPMVGIGYAFMLQWQRKRQKRAATLPGEQMLGHVATADQEGEREQRKGTPPSSARDGAVAPVLSALPVSVVVTSTDSPAAAAAVSASSSPQSTVAIELANVSPPSATPSPAAAASSASSQ